jgi:hypothetical protein
VKLAMPTLPVSAKWKTDVSCSSGSTMGKVSFEAASSTIIHT